MNVIEPKQKTSRQASDYNILNKRTNKASVSSSPCCWE